MDNSPRLERQLLRVERVISTLSVEHGFAFTPAGKLLFHQTNSLPDTIVLSADQEELLGNAVFTHNHPDSRSISRRDVELAMHYELRQIRAVTPWARYSIEPPSPGWRLYRQRIRRVMEEERALVLGGLHRDIELGVLTHEDADRMYEHLLWRRLAARGLLRYRFEFWHARIG